MNEAPNIFRGEIARMLTSRPHDAVLIGRPIVDPSAAAEANFRLDHGGMSRAEWNQKFAEIRREEEREAAVADTQGEPPDCDTRGLTPKRARYARYFAWLLRERKALAALESKHAQFEAMIAAPAATEAAIRSAVRRAADTLMGRAPNGAVHGDRKSLGERLDSEKYAAEAAREALPELDQQIDMARLRVSRLDQRADEFLGPAIAEVAQASGLGDLYLKKIAEFREVVGIVLGLSAVAGGYGTGFGNGISCHVQGAIAPQGVMAVNFPAVGFGSATEKSNYMITNDGQADVWRQLRQSLLLDPFHRAVVPIPKR